MNNPRTIYELLQMLENYDDQRRSDYERLSIEAIDPPVKILLDHLAAIQDHSLKVIRDELAQLDPKQATYLMTGPLLSRKFNDANKCCCDNKSTFEDKLACALASDELRGELLRRLEGGSAAPSVLNLAKRLRELEAIQGRQIANFTRQD